jgi:hypothetical protein
MSKTNHDIEIVQKDVVAAQQDVLRMENEHDWILNQRQYVYFAKFLITLRYNLIGIM